MTTLYGREGELATLTALLDGARERRRGGALALTAGAGMGKTALLDAAPKDGFRVLATTGVPGEAGVPYAGLHRLLRPVLDLLPRLPPPYAQALGAAVGGTGGGGVVPFALCELLSRAAEDGPLLCVADDVQWLDSGSLDALAFAARRVQDEAVAVLFAARDDRRPPRGLDGIRRLPLPPLDAEASLRVLDALLGEAAGGDAGWDLAEEIVDLAGGRPLAIRELAGALTPGQLSGATAPPRVLPPGSTLRALYRHRHLRLPVRARRLALMAVAEERLDGPALARAMRKAGIGAREIDAARESGLLRFDGSGVAVRDPLIRASLWADASRAEQQAAHALLAKVLVQDWQRASRLWHRAAGTGEPDDAVAAALAEAARNGDVPADSWRTWQRAATLTTDGPTRTDRYLAAAADAWTAGRTRRARMLLRRARPVQVAPERAERLRGEMEAGSGVPSRAVRILTETAGRLAGTDALTALMWAAEAADSAGDAEAYAAIAARADLTGDDGARSALVRAHLTGMAALARGRYADAAALLGGAVRLADIVVDPAARACAAIAALALDDAGRARILASGAAESARRRGRMPAASFALLVAARAEALLGPGTAPATAGADGLRLAQATRLHVHAAEQLATLALAAARAGDARGARARLDALAPAAARRGLVRASAVGAWAAACLDLAAGRPADAAGRLVPPGAPALVRLHAAPHLVEALVRDGDPARAALAFADYARWTDATRGPAALALAARCRALLAAGDEAEHHFTEALRLHEAAGADHELARTALLFGHRLRRGRRPRAAREHLRAALRTFERHGAEPWAAQARTELRAAGEPVPGRAAPERAPAVPVRRADLGGLTAQQARIARLAAEGATNREIAARLVLSPRTIDHHLRNVFTRLGIRSRVELARLIG
ncbi:AAA family ATPase [Spirillospora albida]|uniref:AAA family ATPase n=1 Tax=Spirillospora albida TaxID=58123 RepID=UPI0004C04B72|nr:LuxR family transcriptional regulator [Spirillospora albida]